MSSASNTPPAAFPLFVLWGETPDGESLSQRTFNSGLERDAYIEGLNDADGWLGQEYHTSAEGMADIVADTFEDDDGGLARATAALEHAKAEPMHVGETRVSVSVKSLVFGSEGEAIDMGKFGGKVDAFAVSIETSVSAFLVQEFRLPDWMTPTTEAMAQMRRAAFNTAWTLAAHLRLTVTTQLEPLYGPEPEPVELSDALDAAACLWESTVHYLEDIAKAENKVDGPPLLPWQISLSQYSQNNGSQELRALVVEWAAQVHRDWQRAFDAGEFDGCFDWEFVPAWLAWKFAEHFNGGEG